MGAAARRCLSVLTRAAWPAARAWARRGYFRPGDLSALCPRRVALVACHWIGDTFWATQVTDVLGRRFPDAQLYAITKPVCADLWNGLVAAQRVIAAPEVVSDRRREEVRLFALLRRAADLRGCGFDLVIDLTGNRYSAALTFWMRPAVSIGFDGGEVGWLYSRHIGDAERPGCHLSRRPFRVIEPLLAGAASPFAYRLPLRPPAPTCPPEQAASAAGMSAKRYCLIAPGAGWPAKQWPVEGFIAAGRALAEAGLAAVVVGSGEQRALCEDVAAALPDAAVAAGEELGRIVALLAGSAGLLACDSGLGHLAAAMGLPTAVVFTGATDPRLCGPLGDDRAVRVFQAGDGLDDIVRHLLEARGT